MASTDNTPRQPISPAVRKRLQACFDHGSRSAAKGDFKYAAEMFSSCVAGDPGNIIYAKNLLANLAKLYKDNKKGAGFTSAPRAAAAKTSMKRASMSKDWTGLLKAGLDMLQINPWDIPTLLSLADACEGLDLDETQLVYLKWALDFNPKDVDVNRKSAKALARQGAFDQAIGCWQRVMQLKPGDEEAARAMADCTVQKTISKGGYEDAESSTDVKADKDDEEVPQAGVAKLSPQQQLEKAIAKKPEELSNYLDLADLHTREERFKEAEDVLTKALAVAGGELSVRERLEDMQLRRSRQQLQIAEKKATTEKTPEALELYKRVKAEVNAVEIEYFRNRSERHPNNANYKFELGVRLKKAGNYNEAIGCFQKAAADPKRKAAVHMELGECFQYIKQFKLAMSNYITAIEAVGEREVDQRKLALYRAGKLSLGLAEKYLAANEAQGREELARSEKYLNELAGLEFGYKDVPQLLDKISKINDKG